ADDTSTARVLETLLSPNTPDEQWQRAAGSFEELPADLVVRALYPEIAKGTPNDKSFGIYNCSDPAIDRREGVRGRRCVANWLWYRAICCGKGNPKVGKTLLELWNQPQSVHGQAILLLALDYDNWISEAEEPVRDLFNNSLADSGLRANAGGCLLHHFGTK